MKLLSEKEIEEAQDLLDGYDAYGYFYRGASFAEEKTLTFINEIIEWIHSNYYPCCDMWMPQNTTQEVLENDEWFEKSLRSHQQLLEQFIKSKQEKL